MPDDDELHPTGAVRDTQRGKPRYDLIPPDALLRLAQLYSRGAERYSERNWEKGFCFSRVYASLFRHLAQFAQGDQSEDHLAAVAWNAFALMAYQERIKTGALPASLDDMDATVRGGGGGKRKDRQQQQQQEGSEQC